MKKIFGLMALIAVVISSCQKSSPSERLQQEVDMTFTVQMPQVLASKTISEGQNADVLYYRAYAKTLSGDYVATSDVNQEAVVTAGAAQATFRLVKGETYKLVFWAQNSACAAYNASDLTSIKVTYTGDCNDDTRDAFYACEEILVDETIPSPIKLYRPFAQVNFGAEMEDWQLMQPFVTQGLTSEVSFSAKVPSVLNGLTGEATDLVVAKFAASQAPVVAAEQLYVNKKEYAWVAMNYILAGARNNLTVDATFTYDGGHSKARQVTDVPFERNFRTNILGYFFTKLQVVDIIIVPDFVNAETGNPNEDIVYPVN